MKSSITSKYNTNKNNNNHRVGRAISRIQLITDTNKTSKKNQKQRQQKNKKNRKYNQKTKETKKKQITRTVNIIKQPPKKIKTTQNRHNFQTEDQIINTTRNKNRKRIIKG